MALCPGLSVLSAGEPMDWENPRVLRVNVETPHATLTPYPDKDIGRNV